MIDDCIILWLIYFLACFTWISVHSDQNVTCRLIFLLLVKIKLAATLLQNRLNLIFLQTHILWINVCSANRTDIVCVEPCHNAFVMESMAHIASQWSHLIALIEVNEAHNTIRDSPEASLVVRCFWSEINYTLSRFTETVLLGAPRAPWVN